MRMNKRRRKRGERPEDQEKEHRQARRWRRRRKRLPNEAIWASNRKASLVAIVVALPAGSHSVRGGREGGGGVN